MRIECENCSATYTIEDAQLGDQPIGAQCPFCSHVQVVHPGSAREPATPLAPSSSAAHDLGFGPPEPASGYELAASSSFDLPFDSGDVDGAPSLAGSFPSPPSGSRSIASSHGSASSLDLGSAFDLDPGASTARAEEALGFGPDPFAGSVAPQVDAAPSPHPEGTGVELEDLLGNAAPPVPFTDPAEAAGGWGAPTPGLVEGGPMDPGPVAPGAEVDGGGCQECGAPLVDEFDKVIGLCELHQRERRGGGESADVPARAPAGWYARAPAGGVSGPLTLDELRDRIRAGSVPVGAQFSSDGVVYKPLAAFKELSYLASLGPVGAPAARPLSPPAPRSFALGRIMGWLVAAALVAGVAVLGWRQRDDLTRLYQGFVSEAPTPTPTRANPLRRYLASWRGAHPDVSGTVGEHLQAADGFHVQDTWEDYRRAERAYQRALLLDENNAEAIAGYVENLALWRYPLASPAELEVVRSALEYAMELDGRSAPVRRAVGALAWVSGDLNGCRVGADAALARRPTDARSRLVLAGCFLEGNVELAIREAEAARRARRELRRADRVLAEAYRRGGRFKSAFATLDRRLRVDPDNGAVHRAYGELEMALARYGRAERRFRRALRVPGDRQAAWFALGRLAMGRGDAAQAAAAFEQAAEVSPPTGRRGAEILAQWAGAELERGRRRQAEALAERALKLGPKHVGALLVRAEASLRAGSAENAAAFVRRALKEREDEPVALVLSARIAEAEGRPRRALADLRAAVGQAPKDARLHALLAAQFLAAGRTPQAYAVLRKAVDIDPARARTVSRPGGVEIPDAALDDAIAHFRRSAREPVNRSVAYAAIALLEHNRNRPEAATRAIERSLAADDANVLALIHQAQIALEDGRLGAALASANRILLVERGSALGHLLRARVARQRGRPEEAEADFRAALRSNPGLLTAEVELAALELETGEGDLDAARATLERAYTIDPNLLFLREILLEHELGGAG